MSNPTNAIFEAIQSTRTRYVYFLLAVAAASIAFAVTQTNDMPLSLSQFPLGLSVMFWALSFWSGCRNQLFHMLSLKQNAEILRVRSGSHELSGTDIGRIEIAADLFMQEFEKLTDKSAAHLRWQFRFYILGSVFFIAWHILEMYIRTGTPFALAE